MMVAIKGFAWALAPSRQSLSVKTLLAQGGPWLQSRPRLPVALGDECVGIGDPSFLRLEVLAHRGLGRVFEDPALQNFRPGGIGTPPGAVTPCASTRRTVGPE